MTFSKKMALITSCFALAGTALLADGTGMDKAAMIKEGKKVFVTKSLGNCLGCHSVENDPSLPQTGNLGPHLINIDKYPVDWLKEKIWDPNKHNPITIMPPFGKNHKLTEAQIDAVIVYLQETTKSK